MPFMPPKSATKLQRNCDAQTLCIVYDDVILNELADGGARCPVDVVGGHSSWQNSFCIRCTYRSSIPWGHPLAHRGRVDENISKTMELEDKLVGELDA